MPIDHHDDDLRRIWRDLADGRLTDAEAQAATEAVDGRRRRRLRHRRAAKAVCGPDRGFLP